jgi:hypothetical protein
MMDAPRYGGREMAGGRELPISQDTLRSRRRGNVSIIVILSN